MFTVPELPYAYHALEPYIDEETMRLHHDKHHATYVKNLNTALEKYPALQAKTVEELLATLSDIPEDIRTIVRNNAGGHYNHTLFWDSMAPQSGGEPQGVLGEDIIKTFGSFVHFQSQFEEMGMKRFGSGWVWLVKNKEGNIDIISTPNQDNPLMDGLQPILGNDLWEHAYYLKYKNVRMDYLKAWWNVVNWKQVEEKYQAL